MSVTAASGFVASGTAAGIKPDGRLDLSLVATEDGRPVPAAAVFTQNQMTAAPVVTTRNHLLRTTGHAAAVVLNSGNANAANGRRGVDDAKRMCAATAAELGCEAHEVLVCSTGLIGIPLPIDAIEAGVPALAAARAAGEDAGLAAADAILTTDTVRKLSVADGPGFVVGGMAKGAAMLAPNMATMLAVLTTDAEATPALLKSALTAALPSSFNSLSVDGCTSTNDTVILMASGRAGPVEPADLIAAVTAVCEDLAAQMAGDAEGATKVVRVVVEGAVDDHEAERGARKVAESQLVKCSWYGKDPYWGRVASELGSAGISFDPDKLRISYGDHVVADGGINADHDADALSAYMDQRHIEVTAQLGLGTGRATVLTNDLTHAYVDENMGTS
ncbi:bifunctional glutamate N-acetyltransferase/amino-acid acetyltransferase ArgJ [Actinomarinicola tropica]|uniref:Arginine biosynthesis bifunctional protein ArgJ n=1 Tax=Actinomarinicola tropica TaxID=2789776 RepID=A0A5Q2RPR7_9ACTN|nr:bifunctional glutamate N-acetyltransferase/amino-acid acetyltransferase ArgJ [Actinomarinicola tropica]QGG95205.1 bifunctional glutamate N-acetyltransferase/amino-acid acetyltransferase ArgJ [Actinomarinicola tropica]